MCVHVYLYMYIIYMYLYVCTCISVHDLLFLILLQCSDSPSNSTIYNFSVDFEIRISWLLFKGSDRQCMAVEQSMQYCKQFVYDSFERYKKFARCIITEFECKVDVQNHEFGWECFQNLFF